MNIESQECLGDIQRHTNDTDAQSNGAESRPDDEDISASK